MRPSRWGRPPNLRPGPRLLPFAWLALVGSTSLIGACSPANVMGTGGTGTSTSTSSGAGGSSLGAIETACGDYAFAFCERLAACSETVLETRYGTSAICNSGVAALCVNRLRPPGVTTTIADTTACTAALANWLCTDAEQNLNAPPECTTPPGTRPNGAPCAVGAQCASGHCGGTAHTACGVCAPPIGVGSSCETDTCSTNDACVGLTSPVCAAFSDVGGPCATNGTPCRVGLQCVATVCQAPPTALHQVCTPLPAGPGCDVTVGLSCDATKNECIPLTLVPAGAACGSAVAGVAVSCTSGLCQKGTCLGNLPLGAACAAGNGSPNCTPPAHCVFTGDGGTSGTCQIPGSATCE